VAQLAAGDPIPLGRELAGVFLPFQIIGGDPSRKLLAHVRDMGASMFKNYLNLISNGNYKTLRAIR
jgi:hypothetical protein